jgi:hypothetical protein
MRLRDLLLPSIAILLAACSAAADESADPLDPEPDREAAAETAAVADHDGNVDCVIFCGDTYQICMPASRCVEGESGPTWPITVAAYEPCVPDEHEPVLPLGCQIALKIHIQTHTLGSDSRGPDDEGVPGGR